MHRQRVPRAPGDAVGRTHRIGEALDEVLHQHREIPAPGSQRRNIEIEGVDSIVEILAEQAVRDARAQVAVSRGDDAHVDLHRLVAAERFDRSFLQHPEQLGLRRLRQLRDLVQEQRAAMRGLEAAVRRLLAPVKAPRSCPNSSASIKVSGKAAQLTATNGLGRRPPPSCSARATSSLPVPLSPVITPPRRCARSSPCA